MEEAEQFDCLVAMDAGRVLDAGSPADLEAKTKSPSIEEAFIALLPEERRRGRKTFAISPHEHAGGEPVIVARDLTQRVAAGKDRNKVPLQSGFRQRLRDGAGDHGPAAGADPCDF